MSGHTAEEIRGEIRRYWIIGLALFLLTIVTVTVSYLDVGPGMAVFIALVIACFKAGLVAGVFMHLISEKQAVYALLILTALFFSFLMIVPIGARASQIPL